METLNPQQLENLATDLNAIREQARDKVGQYDANYIMRMVRLQRILEISARVLMPLGFLLPGLWPVSYTHLTLPTIYSV